MDPKLLRGANPKCVFWWSLLVFNARYLWRTARTSTWAAPLFLLYIDGLPDKVKFTTRLLMKAYNTDKINTFRCCHTARRHTGFWTVGTVLAGVFQSTEGSSHHQKRKHIDITYKIHGNDLSLIKKGKYLGVTISKKNILEEPCQCHHQESQ